MIVAMAKTMKYAGWGRRIPSRSEKPLTVVCEK
jgi:hypothetical protein